MLTVLFLCCGTPYSGATAEDPKTLPSLEAGLPNTYAAEPITAVVVEESTGFGLEDVRVVARWELSHASGGTMPSLAVQEVATGPDGQFTIPGFPPRPRPSGGALFANSPQLLLFKSGFVPLRLRNEPKETFAKRFPNYKSLSAKEINKFMRLDGTPERPVQTSFWDKTTIQLQAFSGSDEEWLKQIAFALGGIRDEEAPFVPKMLAALRTERTRINVRKLPRAERENFDFLFWRIDRLLEARNR